jgi:hypothetical protein
LVRLDTLPKLLAQKGMQLIKGETEVDNMEKISAYHFMNCYPSISKEEITTQKDTFLFREINQVVFYTLDKSNNLYKGYSYLVANIEKKGVVSEDFKAPVTGHPYTLALDSCEENGDALDVRKEPWGPRPDLEKFLSL